MRNATESDPDVETVPDDMWFKSSFSGAGSGSDCVEVAVLPAGAAIRDSKDPHRGRLCVGHGQMSVFISAVKSGGLGSRV